jgi:hypothetical protein
LVKLQMGTEHPIRLALLALPLYGGVYFAGTAALGIAEARAILKSLRVLR